MSSAIRPTPQEARRWRRYLADERAEAQVYRYLAERRDGVDREILLRLAEAEKRHEQHWVDLLGDEVGKPVRPGMRNRVVGGLAKRFGSVFVLALAQNAESRTPYFAEAAATSQMAADEKIHEEVLRGLAARGRARMTGNFRAAVFGANDGLVSNLALVMGMAGTGAGSGIVLAAGIAGLLAGALSMGAGEFISVQSARELLAASHTSSDAHAAVTDLGIEENELTLVYRSRGMVLEDAEAKAHEVLAAVQRHPERAVPDGAMPDAVVNVDQQEAMGSAMGAASSSFSFFASGALIPVLPFLLGMTGYPALIVAAVLVGLALMITGSVVGLLSGAPPLRRALRQLAIGFGAAGATYLLGLAFGASGLLG
ncbi:VIT1/CCC1 transporter family protein [Ornithinimicrobium cryptoxanthini]|uniref:VIT1/CCC1 transporter family protein n=1 Tax=Ornithinimicrobium cryptoxanthini TaxID=2934161 RepID=UPI0021180B9D|nr:VIT1/CCC1 family protein [Ornithinimicrobium cryptoxanthini]